MRLLACLFMMICTQLATHAQLRVSPDKRFLITPDGKPFFWLGDTAWELFHRLNREETSLYLANRAAKGFNVIQAVVLAELDGLHTPNAYGHTPLKNDDPLQPQEAYFRHIDWVVDEAAKLGLYVGMLPTWGDKLFRDTWGIGPEIFNVSNAEAYGEWIARRYKDRTNIIWILGGDRNPRHDSDLAVWRAMAKGIEQGAGGPDRAMITFHPQPNEPQDGGSSKWFHEDAWLDFNMFQTGHCRENNVWERISVTYNRKPVKPVLDGETIYEDHPVCFNARDLGTSSAYDVRKHAWFSVLAGSFGHTYGCHGIWQMYDKGREPVNGPHYTWRESLELPGAAQMKFLRHLLESRPSAETIPAQDLLESSGNTHDHIQCLRGRGFIIAYTAQGRPVELRAGKLNGIGIRHGWWYNPRDGRSQKADLPAAGAAVVFIPPTHGYGEDWVLVLDDSGIGLKDPAYAK
jgi:hypothetical protein